MSFFAVADTQSPTRWLLSAIKCFLSRTRAHTCAKREEGELSSTPKSTKGLPNIQKRTRHRLLGKKEKGTRWRPFQLVFRRFFELLFEGQEQKEWTELVCVRAFFLSLLLAEEKQIISPDELRARKDWKGRK